MSSVKSTDALMRYLRNTHNIDISGSNHKRHLKNIGYYHGYKGYRFIKNPSDKILFNNFDEVIAINTFDLQLKTLLYPNIMFIETALKNYVLEIILDEAKTESYNNIYENLLTEYKSHPVGSSHYKESIKKRLNLHNKIHGTLTRDYSMNKQVVQHFYHKDLAVPIWAIFEVLSLGEFGHFVSCITPSVKTKIGISLSFNQSCNANGQLLENAIYLLQDLRNSIAHNDVIFDTRFRNRKPNKSLIRSIEIDTNIQNISFDTVTDYIILVSYLLKNIGVSKTEIKRFINNFSKLINNFRTQIPINVYNRIFYTDTRNKINALTGYVSQ